jgi:hypothetical protein
MDTDAALRKQLGAMMASGLQTEWENRAYTSEEVNAVVAKLQDLAPDDYEQKLVIAGFTDYPYEIEDMQQDCKTCMYYLVHRQYCELPELALPVEPQWSCILWRI